MKYSHLCMDVGAPVTMLEEKQKDPIVKNVLTGI